MANDAPSLTHEDGLVAVMVAVSMADADVPTAELVKIEQIVNHLPIFATYDSDRMKMVAEIVFDLFEEEDGLDALFGLVVDAMPARLYETAYAMACDVAAADGALTQPELRFFRGNAPRFEH